MTRPHIDPTVLADKGVPIQLLDRRATLCFGFRALMELEEQFGSIGGCLEVLDQGEQGKAFTGIARIMACGLAHEVTDGASLGKAEVLADHLDPGEIQAYAEAIGEAFTRSFPKQMAAADAADEDADPSSPGASGTTSPESASASTPTSSGA